jgi:transcription elongation factor GreA
MWKNIRLPEIIKAVAHAREHGDLFENAEYHAAREELTRINSKIFHLEQTLAQVQILDESSIGNDQVRILTTVRVRDDTKKSERQYTLVSPEEANPTMGIISIHSPVGRGLIGKKVGDSVSIEVPSGRMEVTILEILPPTIPGGLNHGNNTAT